MLIEQAPALPSRAKHDRDRFCRRAWLALLLVLLVSVGATNAAAQQWRPSLTDRTFNDSFTLNSMVGWAGLSATAAPSPGRWTVA